LEYLHIHEISWGRNLNLYTKFIYVSYIPYTYSLKLILYEIFNNFVYETKFHGVEFSTCAMLVLKNFGTLEHFWF
jgi:hypothetical protein